MLGILASLPWSSRPWAVWWRGSPGSGRCPCRWRCSTARGSSLRPGRRPGAPGCAGSSCRWRSWPGAGSGTSGARTWCRRPCLECNVMHGNSHIKEKQTNKKVKLSHRGSRSSWRCTCVCPPAWWPTATRSGWSPRPGRSGTPARGSCCAPRRGSSRTRDRCRGSKNVSWF